MSDRRITRSASQSNEDLRREIEEITPIGPRTRKTKSKERVNSTPIAKTDSSDSVSDPESEATIKFVPRQILNSDTDSDMAVDDEVAPPQGNQEVSIKDAAKTVPEFDGHNIPVSLFVEAVEDAKGMIATAAEGNLVKLLRAQLKGEARQAIRGQTFETIETFCKAIKDVYAPAKTVNQLLGELGNEYQQENESVIAFANRMRDIGARIIDAKKIEGEVTNEFKTSVESNLIDCFKRGLKFDIEQRLTDANNVSDLVKNAINVERKLAAQMQLRNNKKIDLNQKPKTNKNIFICQVCRKEGHEANKCDLLQGRQNNSNNNNNNNNNKSDSKPTCQICNRIGHVAAQCRTLIECKICNRKGHSTDQCRFKNNRVICQFCERIGHSADKCFLLNPKQDQVNKPDSQVKCQLCQGVGHTATTCRQTNKSNKNCHYCKNPGHLISECHKRIHNENLKASGNGQAPPNTSATGEQPRVRSTNVTQVENLSSELLPCSIGFPTN